MASVAYALLRRLANQDALARVTFAGAEGAAEVERVARDAARAATQLAGLAATRSSAEIERFRVEHGLAAYRLAAGDRVLVESPAGWPRAAAGAETASADGRGPRVALAHGPGGEPWL